MNSSLDNTIPYLSVDYYHKFIEAEKFAFALRTKIGKNFFYYKTF